MPSRFAFVVRDTLKVIDMTLLFSFWNPDLQKTIAGNYWGTVLNLFVLGLFMILLSMVVERYLEREQGRTVWYGIVFYLAIFLVLAAIVYFKWLG